jgi:hypothetical protein
MKQTLHSRPRPHDRHHRQRGVTFCTAVSTRPPPADSLEVTAAAACYAWNGPPQHELNRRIVTRTATRPTAASRRALEIRPASNTTRESDTSTATWNDNRISNCSTTPPVAPAAWAVLIREACVRSLSQEDRVRQQLSGGPPLLVPEVHHRGGARRRVTTETLLLNRTGRQPSLTWRVSRSESHAGPKNAIARKMMECVESRGRAHRV